MIGHNVPFDRARIAEEYSISKGQLRFLDTMSLHIIVNGMTSGQRMVKAAKNKEDSDCESGGRPKWEAETSLSNLRDVHSLYCPEEPALYKATRDVFVTGTLADILADFQSLMRYCALDSAATHRVARRVFPLFQERCPHPATLAGMLEMGSVYLPVSPRWKAFVRQADDVSRETQEETEKLLARQAR